jgi:hypothetical protein
MITKKSHTFCKVHFVAYFYKPFIILCKTNKNNMSRFNRFELDFTIVLKIRSEQPGTSIYRYSTKTITSDYCYNLHDDLHNADISGTDNQPTDDFMTNGGVNITNAQQKLLEFNNRYDMLLPIFTTGTPSMQQWERYVDFIFDARHHFWSSTVPHWTIHRVNITRTNRVNRQQFAHRPIFAADERERLYSSEHYSCIPRFLLYGCRKTAHRKWSVDVAKKYQTTPMCFNDLQSELNQYPFVSVYIFDLFGGLAFKHQAPSKNAIAAIVGKLVTSENGQLHVETVDDPSIIKSVCQKGDNRVESMDYFGLFKFKIDQNSAVHQVIDHIDLWNESVLGVHDKLTIYHMDFTKEGCGMDDVIRELNFEYPGKFITKMHLNHKGQITSIVHPVYENTVYVLSDKYTERRAFYERVKHVYPRFQLFTNQSPNAIGDDIHASLYGGLTTQALHSNLRPDIRNLLLANNIVELCACVADKDDLRLPQAVQYDIVRCFSDILYNNQDEWNQFSIYSELTPYDGGEIKPGEYFVYANQITLGNPLLKIPGGMYPHNFVKYLLQDTQPFNWVSQTHEHQNVQVMHYKR